MGVSNAQEVPVNIVGSSTFGLYPKISIEKTFNMFISEEWLVSYAGWQKISEIPTIKQGRGLFHSIRGGFALGVIGSGVYRFNNSMAPQFIGNIETTSGEVSIDENLSRQICIVDGEDAYIYDYDDTGQITPQNLDFVPGYVAYHNTFFLIASSPTDVNAQLWYTFVANVGDLTLITKQDTFTLQTKPDKALAVLRLPGRGNHVLVLGSAVAEGWTNVGGDENYRRNSSFNIDSGTISVNTIAASEDVICWLGINENNAPAIMVTDGSQTKRISTDGIDSLMQSIVHPEQSTAFFYRQDGHLFYQITFFNVADNISLIHDFNTDKFFHVSDENSNFHPARQVIYFNEKTFFISINDGSVYQMGNQFVTYNNSLDPDAVGSTIPRVRVCKSIQLANSDKFRVGEFKFWIEQGVNDNFLVDADTLTCDGRLITQTGNNVIVNQQGIQILSQTGSCATNDGRPRVDMTFSKNGNQSFSNVVSRGLNPSGKYRNQISWHRMGRANEFTIQLRFWGTQRFVARDGQISVY